MPRFNEKRAEAFGEYTIPALVREAQKAEKKAFVWLSRADLSKALATGKLRDEHIDIVRKKVVECGYGMANLTVGFIFFEANLNDMSWNPDLKIAVEITDHFQKLHGSDAADEALEEESYPHAKPRLFKQRGGAATRSVRVRG